MNTPRSRQALLTFTAAYPLITMLVPTLEPVVGDWPLPARTAVLSALMVGILSFAVMPTLTRVARPWLEGRPAMSKPGRTCRGRPLSAIT